jgi:uracil-DNA glycosylase
MSQDKLQSSAEDFFPKRKSLKAFRDAAADCKGCELWKRGTQTVFGEGARRAEVLFVGEQPGNEEDLSGKPFVGPAGCSTMHLRKPASSAP